MMICIHRTRGSGTIKRGGNKDMYFYVYRKNIGGQVPGIFFFQII